MQKFEKLIKNIRNKKKSLIFFVILLFTAVISLYITYKWCINQNSQRKYYYIENDVSGSNLGKVNKDTEIIQTFIAEEDNLSGFSLRFSPLEQEDYTTLITVTLRNESTSKDIQSWKISGNDIKYNIYDFALSVEQMNIKDNEFQIIISSDNSAVEDSIMILSSKNDTYQDGNLYINDLKESGDLNFSVRGNESFNFIKIIFFVFSVLIISIFIVLYYLIFWVKIKIEKAFVIAAIFIGILYMFILPPYTSPDEQRHMVTAYKYSSIIMRSEVEDKEGKVIINQSDGLINLSGVPNIRMYKLVYDNFFKMRPDNISVSRGEVPVEGTPLVYFPQTMGMIFARLLNLGFIPMLYIARLFNLIFFIGLLYFSIKIIPYGKMILCSVALLPMTIELASSLSYDATAIGVATLFVAYMLKLINSNQRVNKKDIIILAIIFLWLAPLKFVYSTLLILILAIPRNKISLRNKIITIIVLSLFAVFLILIFNLNTIVGMQNTADKLTSLESSQGYTLTYILDNPKDFIKIMLNTFKVKSDDYLISMIGKLGWNDIQIPVTLFVTYIIVLLMSTVNDNKQIICLSSAQKLLGVISIVGTTILLELSMFIGWTPITYHYIEGVQGRYFLPMLPLLLLLLNNKSLTIKKSINNYLLISIFFLQILTLTYIYETIVSR